MTIPESYFSHCRLTPVTEGATTYEHAFNDVSIAYVGSAKETAKCNARLDEALGLQRKNVERYRGIPYEDR